MDASPSPSAPSISVLTSPPAKPSPLSQLKPYTTAICLTFILAAIFSTYLYLRRGYYNLYIINKVLANVSVILLGLTLLLGPLSRFFHTFDKYLHQRKYIGIVGGLLVIFHAIISFFFLPDHFPIEHYLTTGIYPFTFGATATLLLIILLSISNQHMTYKLSGALWRVIQSWGIRIAFIYIALHVFIMKWQDWVKWYQDGGSKQLVHPEWPGAGLLIGWFIGTVILIRFAELLNHRLAKIMLYIAMSIPLLAYLFTFWWGSQLL